VRADAARCKSRTALQKDGHVSNPATLDAESTEDQEIDSLVDLFAILSDRTRLRILRRLSLHEELHVGALCELLDLRQPAVSHHLSRLRSVGVIAVRRVGKLRVYRLLPGRARTVLQVAFDDDDDDAGTTGVSETSTCPR